MAHSQRHSQDAGPPEAPQSVRASGRYEADQELSSRLQLMEEELEQARKMLAVSHGSNPESKAALNPKPCQMRLKPQLL